MADRIEKSFVVKAPVSRVWEALSDHRQFGQWFRVALDQPYEVGGRSTGQMTEPGYEQYKWRAVIEALEPERRLAFRWVHSDTPEAPKDEDPMTLVEFRLVAKGDATEVTITESGFEALPDAKRGEALRSNAEGWDIQAGNLVDYLAG
jgi:uncharacterized protein YndB with AHSA1/START domain